MKFARIGGFGWEIAGYQTPFGRKNSQKMFFFLHFGAGNPLF